MIIQSEKRVRAHFCLNNFNSMFSHRNSLTLFYLFEFEQNVRNRAMLYIQNIQPGDKTKRDFSLYIFHFKTYWYAKNFKTGIRY